MLMYTYLDDEAHKALAVGDAALEEPHGDHVVCQRHRVVAVPTHN